MIAFAKLIIAFGKWFDKLLARIVDFVCVFLLIGLVIVVIYAVIMRYVFLAPPFWGDTVSMLANVAMVLLGIGMAVRRRDLIAMQVLYDHISPKSAMVLEVIWITAIVIFAVIFTVYGYQFVDKLPGFYWEFNKLPKKYTAMIVPVSGVLLFLAAIRIWIEDFLKLTKMLRK